MKILSFLFLFLLGRCVDSFTSPSGTAPSKMQPKQALTPNETRLFNAATAAIPEGDSPTTGEGTATIPNEVFNLIKSIVGSGVLSLPAGKAPYYRPFLNFRSTRFLAYFLPSIA